ncbi:MAG: glycosyltransferase [Apibacter sp.]|uniref:glycosyltransferase n=1 Tax=Apibacter sp. TaxID=2023709 RepID=UPI0026006F29|nr:glycosyltransferase [Apibacter sp.]MCT6868770.1 glycosyltransferase [Apibacter sp.]
MEYELTVIIPVFNEADNLERVKKEMSIFLNAAKKKSKVLFINDGSKDSSLSVIQEICKDNDEFTYISFDRNYGLSSAIKAGFDYTNTRWVGYIDADLQTSPMDFNILLDYADQYQLVTGVRANRKDSIVKNLSSKIANGIRRAFTHDGMDDTGCPLKIIQTDYAKKIPMFKGLHRFLPAMILLQNGKVIQHPVQHFERIAGKSKFHLWNRLFGPLSDCFAFVWMKKKYINYKVAEKKV